MIATTHDSSLNDKPIQKQLSALLNHQIKACARETLEATTAGTLKIDHQ